MSYFAKLAVPIVVAFLLVAVAVSKGATSPLKVTVDVREIPWPGNEVRGEVSVLLQNNTDDQLSVRSYVKIYRNNKLARPDFTGLRTITILYDQNRPYWVKFLLPGQRGVAVFTFKLPPGGGEVKVVIIATSKDAVTKQKGPTGIGTDRFQVG